MSDWFLETGLYLLGVALIPGVGLLLVCWGLWGDRSKGRTRCPKCWYDMRGSLPRLECPECGHDAKQKRRLYRSRRRWRPIVLGVLPVLLFSYPLTIAGGWYREQAIVQKVATRRPAPARVPIVPTWLVARLPEPVARLFYRVATVQLRQPGTDVGLVHLKGLSHLGILDLNRTQVTDGGLPHLKGLSRLQSLSLNRTQVTDVGLAHLKGLSRLQFLSLNRTQVTDVGLAHLKGLTQLEYLHLSDTQVTDAGLVHLKGLSNLMGLELSGAQVTDAGLAHLKGLSKLKGLNLGKTQVTDAGVAALKRALPDVNVMR